MKRQDAKHAKNELDLITLRLCGLDSDLTAKAQRFNPRGGR
jgi:hypothetical protein